MDFHPLQLLTNKRRKRHSQNEGDGDKIDQFLSHGHMEESGFLAISNDTALCSSAVSVKCEVYLAVLSSDKST
jgi:hypothetical protein